MPTSSVITLPLSTLTLPLISRSEIENVFPPMPHIHFKPYDTVEDLQVYHSYLDKLNDMFSPDPDVTHWTPETILSHHVQHVCDGEKRRVYMKIQWIDDDSPRQIIPLDDLRMDDPWLCVRYAYQNNLVYKPG